MIKTASNTIQKLSRINNKGYAKVFKLMLVIVFILVMYWQLFIRIDITALWSDFKLKYAESNTLFLLFALALMPINWLLESKKWHLLVNTFQPFTLKKTINSILSGVCLSILTPHRIGEYGGRLLGIHKANRWKSVISTLISGFSQNFIILISGLFFLNYIIKHQLDWGRNTLFQINLLIAILGFILLFILYNTSLFSGLAKKLKWVSNFKNFEKSVTLLGEISASIISKLLLFSAIRYCVYSIQFLLLLLFFGAEIPIIMGFASIAAIFLIQSGIPLPAIANLIARAEIAIIILGFWQVNELTIISSTLLLWMVNLLIPAIVGLIIIQTNKLTDGAS